MKGKLFGIGTGPGDPDLITQKALETVERCSVVAIPSMKKDDCLAYNTFKKAYPAIDEKQIVCLDFPMTKNSADLHFAHEEAADQISTFLEDGDVAFLTIGDVTIYSTFMYIKKIVESKGFETELVNGVTSFCAAAARLGISLSEQDEEIHIVPANYNLENVFILDGTLVFMKSGKKLLELKEFLNKKKNNYDFDFYGISNCGMENERILENLDQISEDIPYLTLIIIKNKKLKANEKQYSFFQNRKCEMFPCHKIESISDFNCMFCYCPLYFLGDKCGGKFTYNEKGIKSCKDCCFPHEKKNYSLVNEKLRNTVASKKV